MLFYTSITHENSLDIPKSLTDIREKCTECIKPMCINAFHVCLLIGAAICVYHNI